MEGISKETIQGKTVLIIDFTNIKRTKEATQQLIQAMMEEFLNSPLRSVLALMNITHIYFHIETLRAFKNFQEKTLQYTQRVAVVGIKGLMKTGFNSMEYSSGGVVKSFNSEAEAKEWLVQ